MASTSAEMRYEPEVTGPANGCQPKMLSPPKLSASHSSAGLRNGTSTVTPHRPKITDGTAASRLIMAPTGPRSFLGSSTTVASAIPMAAGTARMSARIDVISVP